MNCKYCQEHIVATCQVMWKGYPYHEQCLAYAIQEAYQPPTEELNRDYSAIEDEFDLDYREDFEDETDFANDELAQAIIAEEPEYANGIVTADQMPEGSIIVAPRAIIHPPEGNGQLATTPNVGTLIAGRETKFVGREFLSTIPRPEATATFKPIHHDDLINQIMDSLWYRRMSVVRDEYAVSPDGMKMFGLIEIDIEYKGVRFAIGVRNANDRSMRVGIVSGYKVMVCENKMLTGDFQPMLAKHSKNFELQDALSIACDRIQRNFGALHQQITQKQEKLIETDYAKRVLYDAFAGGKFPISLMRTVHKEFFVAPSHEEFKQSTMWSLENAFTTSFKKLEPVSQFQYTAKLGNFLSSYN